MARRQSNDEERFEDEGGFVLNEDEHALTPDDVREALSVRTVSGEDARLFNQKRVDIVEDAVKAANGGQPYELVSVKFHHKTRFTAEYRLK